MLNFKEITIDDKKLFDSYLKPFNPQASELSFTNLFMWRDTDKIKFVEIESLLCVISLKGSKEPFALMPIGELNSRSLPAAIEALREYFGSMGWTFQFKRLTEENVSCFKEIPGLKMETVYDRDYSDYLYLTEDLINLKGKKYDGKRNHINRFKKEYTFEYVPMTAELVGECKRIMNQWRNGKTEEDLDYHFEKIANEELLDNYEKLDLEGALIKVGGKYEAFTIGEKLNRDTAVIHIEKANIEIHGLFPLINQQFCEREWRHALYINREQDMGKEGLRKAKLSYNPVKLIDKYTLTIL